MVQLVDGTFAPEEARRVGAKRKIHANRTQWRAITQSKSEALNSVVKILQILLAESQADFVDRGIDVAQIIEQHAAQIVANERET